MDLGALERERSDYLRLRADVSGFVGKLGSAQQPLASANNAVEQAYLVDEYRADKNTIYQVKAEVESKYELFTGTIIPAIDSEIERLGQAIEAEKRRIEEERRRREEEARAQAEAEAAAAAEAASQAAAAARARK